MPTAKTAKVPFVTVTGAHFLVGLVSNVPRVTLSQCANWHTSSKHRAGRRF